MRDELTGCHLRLLHFHGNMLDGLRNVHDDALLAETLENGVVRNSSSPKENDLEERRRRCTTFPCSQSIPMTVLSMPTWHTLRPNELTRRHFASIQNLDRPVVEIVVDMLRTGWRDVSKLVG